MDFISELRRLCEHDKIVDAFRMVHALRGGANQEELNDPLVKEVEFRARQVAVLVDHLNELGSQHYAEPFFQTEKEELLSTPPSDYDSGAPCDSESLNPLKAAYSETNSTTYTNATRSPVSCDEETNSDTEDSFEDATSQTSCSESFVDPKEVSDSWNADIDLSNDLLDYGAVEDSESNDLLRSDSISPLSSSQSLQSLIVLMGDRQWQNASNKDLNIFFRQSKKNGLVQFSVNTVIKAHVLQVLSVLLEVDLYTTWIPRTKWPFRIGLKSGDIHKRIARVNYILKFFVDFPWPMKDREAWLHVSAVDDLHNSQAIYVFLRTVQHQVDIPFKPCEVPPVNHDAELLQFEAGLTIQPLGDKCRMSIKWTIQPKFFINDVYYKFLTKRFLPKGFKQFEQHCQNAAADPYKSRRKENRLLYGFIEARLKELNRF